MIDEKTAMADKTIAEMAKAMEANSAAGEPEDQVSFYRRAIQSIAGGTAVLSDRTVITRTCHPWLHPTKGWRNHAKPAGTNRRRRLNARGKALLVPVVRDIPAKNVAAEAAAGES